MIVAVCVCVWVMYRVWAFYAPLRCPLILMCKRYFVAGAEQDSSRATKSQKLNKRKKEYIRNKTTIAHNHFQFDVIMCNLSTMSTNSLKRVWRVCVRVCVCYCDLRYANDEPPPTTAQRTPSTHTRHAPNQLNGHLDKRPLAEAVMNCCFFLCVYLHCQRVLWFGLSISVHLNLNREELSAYG